MNKREFGTKYEELVADYLIKQGFLLLEKNYVTPFGEADLIMRDGNEIVFIEVKARRSVKYGLPAEAVTYSKQKKYLLNAEYYVLNELRGNPDIKSDTAIRFDVAQIYIKEGTPYINYIRNAFDFTGYNRFY